MFTIESNAENVFFNLRRSILLVDDNMEENLRKAAVDSVAIIADRVQQRGYSSSGSRLVTKARIKQGAYSKAHAQRRAERGLQTGHVDLTFEGDLMRNWDVLASSPTEAVVGFRSPEQAAIATYLEDEYGEEIFNLSNSEQDFVVDGLTERVLDDLRSR